MVQSVVSPVMSALDYKRYSLSSAPNMGNLDYKQAQSLVCPGTGA